MKRVLIVALSVAVFQSISYPAWSQNKDQIVGTIFGLILNEAIKNGGSANSGQAPANGTGTAPAASDAPRQPSMDVAERMAVQRALAQAGLYNGAIDGAIGPASRSAIAAWQSSVGAAGSGYLTREQADSLIAMAPTFVDPAAMVLPSALATAEVDPAAIETALAEPGILIEVLNGTTTRETRARFYREFLSRYVFAAQERLDDPDFLRSVLSRSAQIDAFADPRVAEWHEQASRGTEFQRQEVYEDFRLFLLERATDAPLSFVMMKRIPFPEYDFERGRFPFDLRNIFRLNDPTYFGPGDGFSILASPGRWADVSSVAVPEAEAERLATQVHAANGFADVVMRVELANFRQNAEGYVVSDLEVHSVSVHQTVDRAAQAIGPTLLVVPDPASAVGGTSVSDLGPAKDAVESWSRLGAVAAGDRLVIPFQNWEAQKLFESALDYLALANSPDSSLSLSEIGYYGTAFLTEEEQRTLFGGNLADGQYAFSIFEDEFVLAEIRNRFETTYGPALRARAPTLPVAARLVMPVALGDYDFDRQVFPVLSGPDHNSQMHRSAETEPFSMDLTSQPKFRTLRTDIILGPVDIEMPVEEAKAMNARLKSDVRIMPGMRQSVFLAFDLTLETVKAITANTDYGLMAGGATRQSDTALAFTSSVSRAVLYEDAALTRPIQELVLNRVEPMAPDVAEAAGFAMPVGEIGSQTGMTAFALQDGADPDVLTENAASAAGRTGADEFTRPEIVEELVAMVRSAPVPDRTVFFRAQVTLGEYADGAFPVANVQYFREDSTSASGYMLPGDTANITIDNIDRIRELPLPRDEARALANAVPSRSFDALLEVRLLKAGVELSGDSDGRRRYRIEATAVAMHLAEPGDGTRRFARIVPEVPAEKPAPEAAVDPSTTDAQAAAPQAVEPALPDTAAAPPAVEETEVTFDIVGLRLGMSLDEAAAAIGQHMTVSRVLEWRSESVPPNVVGEMVRLYINDGGNEYIIVNYGPAAREPSIRAVARNLFLPVGAVSDGDLAKQLIGKYGEPEPGTGWQWSQTPQLYGCADGGAQYTLSWVGAPLIEGAAMATSPIDPARIATDAAYAAEVLVLARSSNLMYGLGASTGADSACEETVRAEIMRSWATHVTNPPLEGAVSDLFVTRMMDQKVMRQEMQKAMEAERAKAPKVEIKL